MHPLLRKRKKRGSIYVVILGLIAAAIVGWRIDWAPQSELPPAHAVAGRFSQNLDATPPSPPVARFVAERDFQQAKSGLGFSTTHLTPSASPFQILEQAGPKFDWRGQTLLAPELRGTIAAALPPPVRPSMPLPPPASKQAALFNDAQVQSFKDRLQLTAEQERYWPPVEAALRAIAWRRGTIDPASIQTLDSAAGALMARLRDDQKREVRMLAQIVGLEHLAFSSDR